MSKETILITRNIGPDAMALLEASPYELIVNPHDSPAPRSWVLENLPKCQGAIVMHSATEIVNEEWLNAAANLRALATFSVGYDHLDLKGLKAKGIRVGHTPGVLTNAVADITVMLTLMTLRRVEEGLAVVKSDGWPSMGWAPFMLCGPSLSHPNLTLSFLGFGRISQAVVTRLLAFTNKEHPPTIQYHSSRARDNQAEIDAEFSKTYGVTVKRVERGQLAQDADVLVLLCSLNEGTKHFINEDFLSKMKKSAVVINSARGGVVDSDALAAALAQGKIFGAGVDVVEGEPNVLSDHPLVKEPRCIVLPHLGSADDDSRKGMARLCAENILGAMTGGSMPQELQL